MNAPSRLNAGVAAAAQLPAGASQRYCYQPIDDVAQCAVDLAEECALAIAYNGLSQAVMMISPADLEDFVVGFSLANGFVESLDDIYDIRLHGSGSARRAELDIASRAFWRLKLQRRQLPGNSSCGLCGVEALEQALPRLPIMPAAPLPPSHWLQDLRQRIEAFQPLGRDCGAVHAALLMDANGEIRLGREDIGRHNALDKLIGAMARSGCAAAGACLHPPAWPPSGRSGITSTSSTCHSTARRGSTALPQRCARKADADSEGVKALRSGPTSDLRPFETSSCSLAKSNS